ncbi:MAG: type II toxin-antitoxin system RelE/ParE family toxin [Betaproteobacteria bacterium]|nr:type II toxin-antitoxin system RelE/ParE family toxin [Betaproteobacteria bacterium]
MVEIIKSETFDRWLVSLKDGGVRLRVQARIDRLADGNPGDVKPVGSGVSELRIDFGPGYRVYFMQRGPVVIVLLAGGDKRTQEADIKQALRIAKDWKE